MQLCQFVFGSKFARCRSLGVGSGIPAAVPGGGVRCGHPAYDACELRTWRPRDPTWVGTWNMCARVLHIRGYMRIIQLCNNSQPFTSPNDWKILPQTTLIRIHDHA